MKTPTLLLASLLVLPACGKKKDDGGTAAPPATGSAKAPGSAAMPAKPDLPPPPADAAKGQTRLVNLYLDADGKTQDVDVWAKRSFQYGPVKLTSGVGYGKVSEPFGIPTGMSTVVIKAGASVDDKAAEVGGLFGTKDGEKALGFFYFSDGAPSVAHLPEVGGDQALVPPPAGKGLVVLNAGQPRAFAEQLTATVGSESYYVGDGSKTCRHQRIEDKKAPSGQPYQAMILGGTQRPEFEVEPGKAKFTLHKWPGKQCETEPVFEFELDVAAGQGVWGFVHTPDKAKLEILSLPIAL
ncbi:MAG: hypothetical protein R2939_07910 [Kofleriaceae bacterium]